MPSKAVERAVLEMCQERAPGFPHGEIVERESPDFHVLSGGKAVGIEIQEFIQGAGPEGAAARKSESLRATVMRKAQQEFESQHPGVHLYVYSYWGARSPDPKEVPNLARKIASLVWKIKPPPPQQGEYVSHRNANFEELEGASLVNLLSSLDVGLYPPATYGTWNSSEGGYFSQDLDDMQTQVRSKESKVERYRQSCGELWLVIYGLGLPSGYFDIDALHGAQIESSFDHVLFMDAASGRNIALHG